MGQGTLSMSLGLTDAQADRILLKQLDVFAELSALTATPTDDQIVRLLVESDEARAFFWSILPLDHAQQRERLAVDGPLPVVGEAARFGVTLLEIVAFARKYGPQIMAILGQVMELAREFRKLLPAGTDGAVTSTPSEPAKPVDQRPKF